MTTQGRNRTTRAAKLEALQQQLSETVAALVTGEDWKRALEFAAQFRSRGFFTNTMLIYAQHHGAHRRPRAEPNADLRRRLPPVALPRPTRREGAAGVRDPRAGHGQVRLAQPIGRDLVASPRARREAAGRQDREVEADRSQADARLGPVIPRY
jgi:hypothetical protein